MRFKISSLTMRYAISYSNRKAPSVAGAENTGSLIQIRHLCIQVRQPCIQFLQTSVQTERKSEEVESQFDEFERKSDELR